MTTARAGAGSGTEPSDAMRVRSSTVTILTNASLTTRTDLVSTLPRRQVVNALLTQLDKLKDRKNVLIMTTSNIAQAIGTCSHPRSDRFTFLDVTRLTDRTFVLLTDSAFVDRADIKQYIGLPPQQAVYWILCGCLEELIKSDIVQKVVRRLSSPLSDSLYSPLPEN